MRGRCRQHRLGGIAQRPTFARRKSPLQQSGLWGRAIPDRYFTAAFGQILVPLGPMPISCTMVSPSLAEA